MQLVLTVRHPRLQRPEAAQALCQALAAQAQVPARLLSCAPGPPLVVTLEAQTEELMHLLAALDEVEVHTWRLRGQVTAQLAGEADGLALHLPRRPDQAPLLSGGGALSLRAAALPHLRQAPQSAPGWVDARWGGFRLAQGRICVWMHHRLLPGPLARALGARHGRVELLHAPWDKDAPDHIALRACDGSPLRLQQGAPLRAAPTQASLLEDLRALGIGRGDVVMVHASMRAVGAPVEALLEALEAAVTPSGALLALICASPHQPFEDASPAWSDLGVLAEAARVRRGWRRNQHPVARFAAWGQGADALLQAPPRDDYYGPGSPLDRLRQRGGLVLRLGTDTNTTTLFHLAEYLAQVPQARRVTHEVEVATAQGSHVERFTCLDDSHGVADWSGGEDYFPALLQAALDRGAARTGPVGRAHAELLDAREALEAAVGWLRREFVPVM